MNQFNSAFILCFKQDEIERISFLFKNKYFWIAWKLSQNIFKYFSSFFFFCFRRIYYLIILLTFRLLKETVQTLTLFGDIFSSPINRFLFFANWSKFEHFDWALIEVGLRKFWNFCLTLQDARLFYPKTAPHSRCVRRARFFSTTT